MKVISDETLEVHLSSDFFNPLYMTEEHRLLEAATIVSYILRNHDFLSACAAKSRSLKTRKIYMLWAHGVEKKNSSDYWYLDEDQTFSVQEWINQHDGLGFALVIFSCNVIKAQLSSQKSLVLYPTDELSYNDIIAGTHIQLYEPSEI